MESPLLGGYIGATATAGSHEASERQRAPISRASVSERGAGGAGRIAPTSQISRKYCAPTMKIQEVLLAPPSPLVFELLVRGGFDRHEGRSYCVALVKFQERKKPPRERQVNLGGFSLWGLGDYRLCEVRITLPYSKCFSHEFER